MSNVFVIDTNLKPCDPIHPGRARTLLNQGKAAVYRRYPFTIILKYEVTSAAPEPLRLKIDPGSKVTGLAVVNETTGKVEWAGELTHRGSSIKNRLESRASSRGARRNRKTRYRQPRFLNRTKPKGWLAPSLMSRVHNIETWIRKLCGFVPIQSLSIELVKFDTQKMTNPEIKGKEYQQGELAGYEVREYLLEKYQRKCVYCGKENVPLQVEHVLSRAKGGTNRVSNLVIACKDCNQRKGSQDVTEFLKNKPELLKKIVAGLKRPLKDASAVNATRWCLYNRLKEFGLPVEVGSGALTKFNRSQQGLPKTHWLDAVCVGEITPVLDIDRLLILQIKATGHGSRQMVQTDKYGFPRQYREPVKIRFGFQTGDVVMISSGKYAGKQTGRVTIKKRPNFRVNSIDVHPKYLTRIQRADGYDYQLDFYFINKKEKKCVRK